MHGPLNAFANPDLENNVCLLKMKLTCSPIYLSFLCLPHPFLKQSNLAGVLSVPCTVSLRDFISVLSLDKSLILKAGMF